jgi:hypothetical protein
MYDVLPEYILTSVTLLVASNPVKVIVIVFPYAPVVGLKVILGLIVKDVVAALPDVSEALIVWPPLALTGAVMVTEIVPVAEAVVLTMGVVPLSHMMDTGAPGAKPFPVIATCVPTEPPVGVTVMFAEIVKLAVAECCSASETVIV